jgi:ubiquitin carboxyl-terminal hydrolase 25/28
MSLSGDALPPLVFVNDDSDKMDIDQKPSVVPESDDNASEATLVNEDILPPYPGPADEGYVMVDSDGRSSRAEDKENLPPMKEIQAGSAGIRRTPLQDINMQSLGEGSTGKAGQTQGPLTPPPEMPDRPPPIPPRPGKRGDSKGDSGLMFGRQQDVTECIGNVMFQIEAAIKPESIDENGEQIDLLKKYAYSRISRKMWC